MTFRRWQKVFLTVALVGLSVCAVRPEAPPWRADEPPPVAALAGTSRARYVAEAPHPGAPAEARPGDLMIENGFVRFVIAAVEDPGRPCWPGNLIDAALQRGEDGMRLLEPLLGAEPPRRPVYTEVKIQNTGGDEEPAIVTAGGHLFGAGRVRVRTSYSLQPDSRALHVETEVENQTGAMLSLFGLRDVLCQGRTVRFVPGIGMFPAGRRATTRWMAFCRGSHAWGIAADRRGPEVESDHLAGSSVLHYGTVDIPAGESQRYGRSVMAAWGGPPAIARLLEPLDAHERARMAITVLERESGKAIPCAWVALRFPGGHESLGVLTDEAGRAELEVPAGKCAAHVLATGYPPAGPLKLGCIAGAMHEVPMPLSKRATVLLTVVSRTGEGTEPTAGRVRLIPQRRTARWAVDGPAFPGTPWSPLALVNGLAARRIPLPCRSEIFPVPSVLVASKGPLYECAYARIQAMPGEERELQAVLERAVDPGDYVAVDFRQRTAASADCALTLKERALINACEGLDAAVVSDSAFQDLFPSAASPEMCALVPGHRVDLPGVGAFSFFPVDGRIARREQFLKALRSGDSAHDVLETMRQLFPKALVQVDQPLDEWRGLLAVQDSVPTAQFDALEILSGHDVDAARRLLPRWFSMLNDGRRVMVTGGSGSRGLVGNEAGCARTFIHCPGAGRPPRRADVIDAILRLKSIPNAFVTNGPFVEAALEGQPPGSTQTLRAGTARLRVKVSAARWIDVQRVKLYRNGELIEQVSVPSGQKARRCDRTFELQVPGDCWFVVVVEGDRGLAPVYGPRGGPTPWAVTNPFWVDADADGDVRVGGGG